MARRPRISVDDFPAPGTVFVAPTTDGRLAAGRVLRRQFEGGAVGVLIAASSWLGTEIPPADAPELRAPLVLTHHKWQGRREIYWAHDAMPQDFIIIGTAELSGEDLAASSNSFGSWHSVPLQALLQWRWDNDREALLLEEMESAAAEAKRRQEVAAARAEFMRTLTLDSLSERKWLASWDSENSAIPIDETRQLLNALVVELRSQPKRTKAAVRKRLKECVHALNTLDAARTFIFTIEREDLCEALEQIACAAGFPQLADEIENWRKW